MCENCWRHSFSRSAQEYILYSSPSIHVYTRWVLEGFSLCEFFSFVWKRTIQYAHSVVSAAGVCWTWTSPNRRSEASIYTLHFYIIIIYIILLSLFAGVGVGTSVPFQQCVLFAKPFSRAPVPCRKPEQMRVTPTLADVLKTPRRVANNILYTVSTKSISRRKRRKKGFLCI